MPSKNVIKQFDVDSMYHVYNRGNNKRQIFFDERDYSVFLSFLKYALLSDEDYRAKEQVDSDLITQNKEFFLRRLGLHGKVELVSYCLMPNHFHLQLFQYEPDAITSLMRSIATGYVMYFNKRYGTSGGLFQGVYKASKISYDGYWQHLSRYIHLNPVDLSKDYRTYEYSSYKYYTGEAKAEWVIPEKGMLGKPKEYKTFVADWIPYRDQAKADSIGLHLADN